MKIEIMPIIKWVIGVIGGAVFLLIVSKYLYNPIAAYAKSFFVVSQLLKETRPTRNARKGKHLADRLLDIWNNDKPLPLVSRDIIYLVGNWQGVWNESVIDKKLQEKGLVEIYQEGGKNHARLSNNLLTKSVIKRLNRLVEKGVL